MSKKISRLDLVFGFLSGLCAVLGWAPISWVPFLFFCPFFLYLGVHRARTWKEAFWVGYFANLAIMFGAFYWVTYVLHLFGDMSWPAAAVTFCFFAALGSLNFPIFTMIYFWGIQRWRPTLLAELFAGTALFLLLDWGVPKLFPWSLGHGLYQIIETIQITDITGIWGLTWALFFPGFTAAAWFAAKGRRPGLSQALGISVAVWVVFLSYGVWRLADVSQSLAKGKTLPYLLVQANIGSLDKFGARQGIREKVRLMVNRYIDMTRDGISKHPETRLVLWPETAMPFSLESDLGESALVRDLVRNSKFDLLAGGFARGNEFPGLEYNAAFLLTHDPEGKLATQIYRKHVLLAFGEYFPGGDWFPSLYRWFPAVSHFGKGEDKDALSLSDGTKIGPTICYEAIIPSYFHRIHSGMQIAANLTNDSWFGPAGEPYQHGALSVFRAVEARVPFLRVTNTGTSFVVDATGKIGPGTPVYDEGIVAGTVRYRENTAPTIYSRLGDWLVNLQALFLVMLVAPAERRRRAAMA